MRNRQGCLAGLLELFFLDRKPLISKKKWHGDRANARLVSFHIGQPGAAVLSA